MLNSTVADTRDGVTKGALYLPWLNGDTNAKGYPDENYGREMLELFTLARAAGTPEHRPDG